jgi:hypothetical protein
MVGHIPLRLGLDAGQKYNRKILYQLRGAVQKCNF